MKPIPDASERLNGTEWKKRARPSVEKAVAGSAGWWVMDTLPQPVGDSSWTGVITRCQTYPPTNGALVGHPVVP
ncbi:hypothetical protein Aduo_001227 [Ancylostoma duodenale]